MRRQPEIGSAVGLTTDEVVAACDARLRFDLRADLTSELATAIEAVNRRDPLVDIVLRLNRATDGMLDRWRS